MARRKIDPEKEELALFYYNTLVELIDKIEDELFYSENKIKVDKSLYSEYLTYSPDIILKNLINNKYSLDKESIVLFFISKKNFCFSDENGNVFVSIYGGDWNDDDPLNIDINFIEIGNKFTNSDEMFIFCKHCAYGIKGCNYESFSDLNDYLVNLIDKIQKSKVYFIDIR